ncbi:hypothetical protein [Nisaea sp.]|uniref:hypothetical protein n=1 Tax=Nisaea sp. TaxID=2024842 RepID=UPI002B277950|nr:hypothetical protein [Nisaea sp.]
MDSYYHVKAFGLTLREILTNTFGLYSDRFLFYTLVLVLPGIALNAALLIVREFGGWWPRGWEVLWIVGLKHFVWSLSIAIVSVASIKQLRSARISSSAAVRAGSSCAPWVFMATALAQLGITIGFLLLVVPGVMALCSWFLAAPIAAMERVGPLEATESSAAMVRGYQLQILGVITLLFLATVLSETMVQYGYWLVTSWYDGRFDARFPFTLWEAYLFLGHQPGVALISDILTVPFACISALAPAYIYAVLTSAQGPYANRDYVAHYRR